MVFPSTASDPPCTVEPSTVRPEVGFHCDKVPLSKPSANTGTGGAGVVTEMVLVSPETLPAMSRARTAYWWVEDPSTDVSV